MDDIEHLRTWIGRETRARDVAAAAPLAGLAALLDHERAPWREGEVPPLGHWLYFLPHARQSALSGDGHPQRGDFMPPTALPRRMWAGGAVRFHRPLAIGEAIERRSRIANVEAKAGASGSMLFVAVDHALYDSSGALCIAERQDIVYRDDPKAPAPAPPAAAPAAEPSDFQREIRPDPALLFRYSALTFNAHRIHYDRDYAREIENYPALVVQGPLTATLLVDHFLRETPEAAIATFAFRARRPLFDTDPIALHLRRIEGGAEMWAARPDGEKTMTASIGTETREGE